MFKILYIVLILFSKTQSAQKYKKIFEFANFSKECANFSKEKHKKGNLPLKNNKLSFKRGFSPFCHLTLTLSAIIKLSCQNLVK